MRWPLGGRASGHARSWRAATRSGSGRMPRPGAGCASHSGSRSRAWWSYTWGGTGGARVEIARGRRAPAARARHEDLVFLSLGAPSSDVLPPVTSLPFRERVEEVHQAADIFVSASRSEGFGNGLVEGLASGCVAVGTLVEGQREIFEGLPGCRSVPVEDPVAIADAIEFLLPSANAGPSSARGPSPHRPQLRAARLGSPDGRPVRRAGGAAVSRPGAGANYDRQLIAGGAERVAVEIACGLDRHRFTPHVVVTVMAARWRPSSAPPACSSCCWTGTPASPGGAPADLGARRSDLIDSKVSELRVGRTARTCRRGPLVTHDNNWSAGHSPARSLVTTFGSRPPPTDAVRVRSVARALAEEGVPPRDRDRRERVRLQASATREEARRRLGSNGSQLVVGPVAALRPRRRTSCFWKRSPSCAPRTARCGSVSSAPGRAPIS